MKSNFLGKIFVLFLLLTLLPISFSRKRFLKSVFHDEEAVLLELKRSFSDLNGVLSSWDPAVSHHCSWYGVSCNSDSRVTSLILRGCDDDHKGYLHSPGSISSKLDGGIRFISVPFIDLRSQIPKEIWKLDKLELLVLQGNSFTSESPEFRVFNLAEILNPAEDKSKLRIQEFQANFGKSLKIPEIFDLSRFSSVSEIHGSNPRKLMALNNEEDEETPSLDTPPSKSGLYPIEIASIVSASVIVFILLILVLSFIYTRKRNRNSQIQVIETKDIKVFSETDMRLTYDTIVRATGYFTNSNCIGHGGFGSTYKAEVSPTNVYAVKRLSVGRFQGDQQFHAEIAALEMVKHPNLVRLIGYHASESEMFLIYNYLSGGNLEDFIKERSKPALQWKILHKIALDVARSLAYLHDKCSPKVLHRDIKPSNILLDNNYTAYLSDFGLSKLLGTSQSHVTTGVAGTFGYVAPEYALTCRVSEKADVYSYGIVLLELISDKRALDPSFSSHENGFNIVSWGHMMLSQGKAKDVFTKGLWETGPQDDLVEVLHLALKCTMDSLSIRPTMKQVVRLLKRIQPSRL